MFVRFRVRFLWYILSGDDGPGRPAGRKAGTATTARYLNVYPSRIRVMMSELLQLESDVVIDHLQTRPVQFCVQYRAILYNIGNMYNL